tara:strand:- start:90 stop:368 length:279 start_codon:yes stop_codon:yes gene_type:complete
MMSKLLYFIKWLLNWNKWYPFQRRYVIYFFVSISLAFIFSIEELLFLPALLVFLDFSFEILRDKWKQFNQEQEDMLKEIGTGKKGYRSMLKE